MSKKNKDQLKFTLFPFVSILLAVIGVLLFLTMLQAVLLKGDSKKEEKKKPVEENTRVFERIPELNTTILTFSADYYQIKLPSGEEVKYTDAELADLLEVIKKSIVMINLKRTDDEDSRREHLLYVVESEGANRYFSFFERTRLDRMMKAYLPTGLVLLNPGEKFNLK
jgi:flagellar basal body-associated protein FliL